MHCLDRFEEFKDEPLDIIIMKIRNGTIKCGRYSNLVKIDKNKEMKGKEFFTNGKEDSTGKRG